MCCASREPAQNFQQYIDTESGSGSYIPLRLDQHWNSEHMRSVRRRMLAGETLPECEVCNNKLLNTDVYRDYFTHQFGHKLPEVYESTAHDGSTTMQPVSWDYRFSNLCNFKCRTCGGMLSSAWETEQRQHNMIDWSNPRNNWMRPEIKQQITQFQDTQIEQEFADAVEQHRVEEVYWVGGEPLMYEQHWRYMKRIIELGDGKKVYARYNTNLSRVEYRGINLFSDILDHVRDYQICASLDGTGAIGEYIRTGLDYWKALEPGRCRYGLLLKEDGFITDDGVSARLAPDRFHLTTTTGGAARVLNMMEDYLQTEWPDLDVWLTSTTEQYAVIALQGPNARKLLEPLVEGIDLSADAFPHMAIREGTICGIPTRLFRVSFTGELGFEINVPTAYGRALWEHLMAEGAKFDITPYGTEAMHVLRAEKGFIIVGQDTDGTITPFDAGLDWAVGKKKPDFVGKRSMARPDIVAPGRKQLVGLLTDDPNVVLEEGAQIVADPRQPIPMTMIGHVTSSYWSETLGRSIAFALVAGGHEMMGGTLHIPMPGKTHSAKVSGMVFYDAEGARLHV